MDLSIKTVFNTIFVFIVIVLLSSIVTLSISYNNASTALYQTIQQVEIYGSDVSKIETIAQHHNVDIVVLPVDDFNKQYKVQVNFKHFFSFIDISKKMSITGYTRVME